MTFMDTGATRLPFFFLLVVITLAPIAAFSGAPQSLTVLIALLVCLIPTTIGALLSAIGIAGMDRLVAYQLCSMVAGVPVGNMVDPLYSLAAKFPKRYLPA